MTNGAHAMKKTKDFSEIPHMFKKQQDEDAGTHNVAQIFAKLNMLANDNVEVMQTVEAVKNGQHDKWLDLKRDISDVKAMMNTFIATAEQLMRNAGRELPPALVNMAADKPKQQRKQGLQAAIVKIMADGVARHSYDINRLLTESDGEGWPEASVGNILINLTAAYKLEKIRRGVYRLHPSQKETPGE